MNSAVQPTLAESNLPAGLRWIHRAEEVALALALAALAVLPVIEILARRLSVTLVSNNALIEKHLVLVIAMAGGALAARQGRLLSMGAVTQWLSGRVLTLTRVFASAVGVAVSFFLALAAWIFVGEQRGLALELAYGVPVWWVQCVLVAGFAVIGLRQLWTSAGNLYGRLATAAVAGVGIATLLLLPADTLAWRIPLLVILGVAVACGTPLFTGLGGIGLVLLWSGGDPISSIALQNYGITTQENYASLPLFTLAGCLLAAGGAASRLVRLFQALVGRIRGGPALITALVCAFFTSFTGASGVTILALGGVLMPILAASRFPDRASLGLLTGAGSLGLLFPPCLPPILFAIVASTGGNGVSISINEMFQAGLLPGLLLVGLTASWGMRQAPARSDSRRFDWKELGASFWEAKWELLAPVVAIVALFSGWATYVEASALTALYAFVVTVIIWRDLRGWREIVRVFAECGLLIGAVLLILGVALGLTFWLTLEEVPVRLAELASATIGSKWLFLLALNGALLVLGALVDIFSAIVVAVPLVIPLGLTFGINPIHLGIIFLANLELGYLTPPVGLNLILSASRFNRSMGEVIRASLPILGVMAGGVLLITFIEPLSTWLPEVLK